jgi:serine protease Do
MRLLKYFLIGALFGAVAFAVARWVYFGEHHVPKVVQTSVEGKPAVSPAQAPPETSASSEQERQSVTEDLYNYRSNAITQAIQKAVPAVVGISVTQVREYVSRNPFWDDPFFRDMFPPRIFRQKIQNLGSGFIISADGYIVTNEHVVHDATEILVTMTGGAKYKATIAGSDPFSDVALLKIDAQNLPYLPFGNSSDVIMGEWAIALGNPFGLFDINDTPSVTVGVISATGRDFDRTQEGRIYSGMIQTDASINRGNSGGPLVNSLGEVIGMNTMIFTEGGGGSLGVGFAIPINRIKDILKDLQSTGMVNRNYWIGLSVQNLNSLIALSLGLKSEQGVIISNLDPKSPAQKAGLKVGDVILEIAGTPVQNYQSIQTILDRVDLKVGQKLPMKVFRDGKQFSVEMLLEEVPQR